MLHEQLSRLSSHRLSLLSLLTSIDHAISLEQTNPQAKEQTSEQNQNQKNNQNKTQKNKQADKQADKQTDVDCSGESPGSLDQVVLQTVHCCLRGKYSNNRTRWVLAPPPHQLLFNFRITRQVSLLQGSPHVRTVRKQPLLLQRGVSLPPLSSFFFSSLPPLSSFFSSSLPPLSSFFSSSLPPLSSFFSSSLPPLSPSLLLFFSSHLLPSLLLFFLIFFPIYLFFFSFFFFSFFYFFYNC